MYTANEMRNMANSHPVNISNLKFKNFFWQEFSQTEDCQLIIKKIHSLVCEAAANGKYAIYPSFEFKIPNYLDKIYKEYLKLNFINIDEIISSYFEQALKKYGFEISSRVYRKNCKDSIDYVFVLEMNIQW